MSTSWTLKLLTRDRAYSLYSCVQKWNVLELLLISKFDSAKTAETLEKLEISDRETEIMTFDFTSFVIGLAVAGAVAWIFFWSEKASLANRIAHNLINDAQNVIRQKYLLECKNIWRDHAQAKLENINSSIAEGPRLTIFGEPEIDKEKIYPIDDENFLIQKVPALRVQTDVHIEEYLGVYSKKYNLWFLIEENYGCETLSRRYSFYLSNSNFDKKLLIKLPYDFDLIRHLKA